MKKSETNYPYRILSQIYFDQGITLFTIESIEERKIHLVTAADAMTKSYFLQLRPKDIAAIIYTYADERFAMERLMDGSE